LLDRYPRRSLLACRVVCVCVCPEISSGHCWRVVCFKKSSRGRRSCYRAVCCRSRRCSRSRSLRFRALSFCCLLSSMVRAVSGRNCQQWGGGWRGGWRGGRRGAQRAVATAANSGGVRAGRGTPVVAEEAVLPGPAMVRAHVRPEEHVDGAGPHVSAAVLFVSDAMLCQQRVAIVRPASAGKESRRARRTA